VLQQDKTHCRHASDPGYGMFARGRIREIRRRVRWRCNFRHLPSTPRPENEAGLGPEFSGL